MGLEENPYALLDSASSSENKDNNTYFTEWKPKRQRQSLSVLGVWQDGEREDSQERNEMAVKEHEARRSCFDHRGKDQGWNPIKSTQDPEVIPFQQLLLSKEDSRKSQT